MEEPSVVNARVNGEGFFTEGVVIDEVGPGGCLPTVGVRKELAAVSFVGDEVPVEMGGIVPVSVGVEGKSSEDLEVSVSKSGGDSHFPVLWHAVVGNQRRGLEERTRGALAGDVLRLLP